MMVPVRSPAFELFGDRTVKRSTGRSATGNVPARIDATLAKVRAQEQESDVLGAGQKVSSEARSRELRESRQRLRDKDRSHVIDKARDREREK